MASKFKSNCATRRVVKGTTRGDAQDATREYEYGGPFQFLDKSTLPQYSIVPVENDVFHV
jgi:hypothetical protein